MTFLENCFDSIEESNTRYKVLRSLAILLEITANLYAGRRNCEFTKRGNATGSASRTHRQRPRGASHTVKAGFAYTRKGISAGKNDAVEARACVGAPSRQPAVQQILSNFEMTSILALCLRKVSRYHSIPSTCRGTGCQCDQVFTRLHPTYLGVCEGQLEFLFGFRVEKLFVCSNCAPAGGT